MLTNAHAAAEPAMSHRTVILERLASLRDAPGLTPEQHGFVLFSFRASDPEVYLRAAAALGRHMPATPGLFQAFQSYSAARGFRLDKPLTLNGQRGARRILMTRIHAMGSDRALDPAVAPHWPEPAQLFPLAADTPGLPAQVADATICLLALHDRVMQGGDTPAFTAQFLHDAVDRPELAMDRGCTTRWADLVVALANRTGSAAVASDQHPVPGHAGTGSMVQRLVQRIQQLLQEISASPGVEARVHGLLCLDRVLAATTTLTTASLALCRSALTQTLPAEQWLWIELRLQVHARRAGVDLAPAKPSPEAPASPTLQLALLAQQAGSRGRTGGLGSSGQELAELHVLQALLPVAKERAQWFAAPDTERALRLFLLLDLLDDHGPLPVSAQALADDQVDDRSNDRGENRESGNSDRISVLLSLITSLSRWEGLPPADLLDANHLHGLHNPWLQIAMLPSRHETAAVSTLADVVENRLRLDLAHKPAFDPRLYLLQTLIRKPGPGFYRALLLITAERQYISADGRNHPVQDWLRELLRLSATEATQTGATRTGEAGKALVGKALLGKDGVGKDSFSRLRAPDQAHRHGAGPHLLMAALGDWIGRPDQDLPPAADSVLGVLRACQPHDRNLLHSDTPDWTPRTLGELETLIDGHLDALTSGSLRLDTNAWHNLPAAREAAARLHIHDQALATLLYPVLPAPDARLLASTLQHVDQTLRLWLRGLEACHQGWAGLPADQPLQSSHWDHLVDGVLASTDNSLPGALVPALMDALFQHAGQERDPVGQQRLLMDWAMAKAATLPAASQDDWNSVLIRRWRQLLELAMAGGETAQVKPLLQAARYGSLRSHPDNATVLASARPWSFDRFQPGLAFSARLAANPDTASLPREIGAYLLHFSAVWIGLLVGAILMLDFGDPWRAMAEVEDVTGILLTGLLGLGGTFLYLFVTLAGKVRSGAPQMTPASRPDWLFWGNQLLRTLGFLLLCALYTLAATGGLWLLLSGTDEVVHGPWAIGHIVVWAGFALFTGTFFGLVAKGT